MRVLLVAAAVVALAVVLGAVAKPPEKRTIVNGRQLAYLGKGPERWAQMYRVEHQRAQWNKRKRLELRREVTQLRASYARVVNPRDPNYMYGISVAAIRAVFGVYGDQAVAVARCETGGTFDVNAQNGQYLGLFQMGEYARGRYGHSETALGQARAAYRYFVDSGRDWSPWECKP